MASPRVLLVGSYRDGEHETQPDLATFGHAVVELVTQLRAAHRVRRFTLCSLSPRTVDFHVLDALRRDTENLDLEIVYPDTEDATVVAQMSALVRDLRPGTVKAVPVPGGWRPAHLRALKGSDLVIALGGSDRGTATVIYSAEVMGIPVVVVPTFGGATRGAWRDFSRFYSEQQQSSLQGHPTAPGWAADVANVAMNVLKRNPFAKVRRAALVLSGLLLLLGVAGWLFAHENLAREDPFPNRVVGLAAGLVAAALAGHLFGRIGSRAALGPGDHLRVVILAIGTAFAVLLTTEAASFLLSGKAAALDQEGAEAQSLLMRLSVVAFLAGLVADEFFDALVKKAQKQFT